MQKIHTKKKLFIGNIKITEMCYQHFFKKAKQSLSQYFKANTNKIKNTWKGRKSLKIYLLVFQRVYPPMVPSPQTK